MSTIPPSIAPNALTLRTVEDLAVIYLQVSAALDRLELRATPQGVIEALQDARSALWSGLEVAKDLAAMATEAGA